MTSERGAVGLIAAALLVVGLLLALMAADVARVVEARARMATAADAAALAAAPVTFSPFGAAATPADEAAAIAAANGASLVECHCEIDRSWSSRTVVVTVGMSLDLFLLGRRDVRAMSAAEFRPIDLGS